MKKTIDWLVDNWFKGTPFLTLYTAILLFMYVKGYNYALFLIWLQCPAYWFHEFEEYILPGGFLDFFNQKGLGSTRPDLPLSKVASFWINIPLMFVLLPLSGVLSHYYGLGWGFWTAFYSTLNASAHLVMAIIYRKYNPGLVASVLVNIPLGIYTIIYFLSNHLVSTPVTIASIIVGIIAQASMMVYGFAVCVPRSKREGYHKSCVKS